MFEFEFRIVIFRIVLSADRQPQSGATWVVEHLVARNKAQSFCCLWGSSL